MKSSFKILPRPWRVQYSHSVRWAPDIEKITNQNHIEGGWGRDFQLIFSLFKTSFCDLVWFAYCLRIVYYLYSYRLSRTYIMCQLSGDVGYVMYSAFGSFYIPSCIMVFVYIKIYFAARFSHHVFQIIVFTSWFLHHGFHIMVLSWFSSTSRSILRPGFHIMFFKS